MHSANDLPRDRATVRMEFSKFAFHDFALKALHLHREQGQDDITLELFPPLPDEPGYVELTFLDCAVLRADIDLIGKSICADAVAGMYCEVDSKFSQAVRVGKVRLYEGGDLSSYAYFQVLLCPPGGELDIFARDFYVDDHGTSRTYLSKAT